MKKIRYISHICPEDPHGQICNKFFGVAVANVITCDFFGNRLREVEFVGVKNQWFSVTKPVAINTVLPLPCSQ